MTCSYFTYDMDISYRTLVACRLRQQQLVQGEHLTKQCRHWLPVWEEEKRDLQGASK